ncbi:MAG: 50S ribosome-binding GTPase [Clostridiales bacterium]|nr:50S ribosome-binding GTPase [Clostridiales bacterium]MCF8021847.1 50S ribosome-binding GTPase [Clostridiales bacterium]
MGLTYQSTGITSRENFNITCISNEPVIALAGNPNTGKSTLFNALTGLRQHTGNWPGKTVLQSKGTYIYNTRKYLVVDLPGTYSLLANSVEEEVARDFICFAKPEVTIVVVDSTCMERNLNMVLQVMEITSNVIVCLNLIDEARRKKIQIDTEKLSRTLGIPVIPTAARNKEGIEELMNTTNKLISGQIKPRPNLVKYDKKLEDAILHLESKIKPLLGDELSTRWIALRLLDRDTKLISALEDFYDKHKILEMSKEVMA